MAGMGMGGSIGDTLTDIFQVPENAVGLGKLLYEIFSNNKIF